MLKIFFLLGVSFAVTLAVSPFLGYSYDPYEFHTNCSAPGLMCASCSELVQCIGSEGHFETILIENCDNEQNITCYKDHCTKDPNPRCPIEPLPDFTCQETGVFPNPYDCTLYHICASKEDTVESNDDIEIQMKCNGNYGYNPISTYCDIKLEGGICPETTPVPKCETAGQSGAIEGTSIYYLCLRKMGVIIPQLYMCPHGSIYEDSKCVDK